MLSQSALEHFRKVKEKLSQYGVLLHSDLRCPSLVSIVVGGPVHGSWWAHPKGRLIFQVGGMLAEDPDVLLTKLVSGKETYLHRALWSPFLVVAKSRESWQLGKLSSREHSLFDEVELRGELRTDEFAHAAKIDLKSIGDAARQLERNLLVFSENIHTERGFHSKLLKKWSRWTENAGFRPAKISLLEAKQTLEGRVERLNQDFAARERLPWRQ